MLKNLAMNFLLRVSRTVTCVLRVRKWQGRITAGEQDLVCLPAEHSKHSEAGWRNTRRERFDEGCGGMSLPPVPQQTDGVL